VVAAHRVLKSTIASSRVLDHLHDVPEFKKRHGSSLIRLRDGVAKLLDS
jgi:hypothetical protein